MRGRVVSGAGLGHGGTASGARCATTVVGRPRTPHPRRARQQQPQPLRALGEARGEGAYGRTGKESSSSSSASKHPVLGRSIEDLQAEMSLLQEQIHEAHLQAHVQEQRIEEELRKLREVDERSKALEASLEMAERSGGEGASSTANFIPEAVDMESTKKTSALRSDLRWPKELKDYWYPLEFSKNLDERGGEAIEFDAFDVSVSLSRSPSSASGLELRQVGGEEDGRAFPALERDGMVWCWLSDKEPAETAADQLPGLTKPPPAFREESPFVIHAELVIDVPVEHGLLLENLLDLAHAPFTHTATFAKGWSIPDLVKFNTQKLLGGNWEPYPIDMSFEPPCMVLSTIGLAEPGKLEEGARAAACENHLHQLHVCVPAGQGTRLLYRMSLDFMGFMLYVPLAKKLWETMAAQVLGEDLVLVQGQEDRLKRGGDTWANPVPYDKLAVRYRKWRNSLSDEELRTKAEMQLRTMSAGEMLAPVEEEDE
ncbi:chlorophyllide a oxygenase [Chloropicon primus]|uniref:Chlorophyllide a oxygenase n=1 Tax=Chloropicon primus TaxID=1764295 RepID=A0A5B8MFH4_9CHLO|nr:chlorophyllide a oxygenase [Chloropicon primus]|eukprot:QDZ19418.1 chlorophyllide a oxygenase [Chloropicon primus]